jgi:2-phospho-L-lactate guanylyltransferase
MVMCSPDPHDAYGVLVPVKPPAVAKSRLSSLGDDARAALVVAFVVDTVNAALESPMVGTVLVVTDDYRLAGALSDLGVAVIPDGAASDLNGSLVQGAAELHRRHPDLKIAALCGDLPALRPEHLARALAAARPDVMSFVADADGIGTTAVMAPTLELFRPLFGPESRQAHLDEGAVEIDLADIATLRRDVDTPADLVAARALGLGRRTSLVTTGLRL